MDSHLLEDVTLTDYAYEFPQTGALADPALQAEVLAMLPPNKDQKISFYLSETHRTFANAIRRTVTNECRAVALQLDLEDIVTDEKFILVYQLAIRVGLIPISQDLEPGTTFTLEVKNPDTSTGKLYVYSGDLKFESSPSKKAIAPDAFDKTFRLAWLRPGKSLKMARVTVVQGCGYENAKFSLTNSFAFMSTDHTDVRMLGASGRSVGVQVLTQDLLDLMKEKSVTVAGRLGEQLRKGTARDIFKLHHILVIPNKQHVNIAPPSIRPKFEDYDLVIMNNKDLEVNPRRDNEFIRVVSSMSDEPTEYYMEFRCAGNITPINLLAHSCDDLAERLESISKDATDAVPVTDGAEPHVSFEQDGNITTMKIMGEDYTIGHLLAMAALIRDSTIPNIRAEPEHPLTRTLMIRIWHADAKSLMIQCCDDYAKHFRRLADEFRGVDVKKSTQKSTQKPAQKPAQKPIVRTVSADLVAKAKKAAVPKSVSVDGTKSKAVAKATSKAVAKATSKVGKAESTEN